MRKASVVFFLASLLAACGDNSGGSGTQTSESTELKNNSTPTVAPTKSILTGKFSPSETTGFTKVPDEMASKPMFIQTEVLSAFERMREAAAKERINLYIVSGTRTFNDQKAIWERKWSALFSAGKDSLATANEILEFSSMPGTSRHHWGTDIDLVSVEPAYFESGEGLKMYNWLIGHAGDFGFCQVYSNKEETQRKGYNMEKWHWSYTPISTIYLKAYLEQINYSDIQGFTGDKLPARLRIKEEFVQGIDSRCAK